ncbi:scavenger receptor class F member 1-like [Haliotis rubra]|uniref:scavenger receptor class F member 1-like n=1 Tax=Haliotis rubra TaxID=36100 RepID=UPI001EE59554|nr:scavenger receptor class F member 1-like [Haliotis rubra]XP_046557435.1 scavenger receptor class F member 1-like [Haliotis rubra]
MADLKKLCIWITYVVLYTEAGPCLDNQHCSDCDVNTGHCLTECEMGYYDLKCFSVCDGHCKGNPCNLSADGSGRCNEGCVPGYQGIGCNIPCDSPGGSCTACPGGCDGGYCQVGSSCVSGCVDSYYGTGCKKCSSGCTSCNRSTGTCDDIPGNNVELATALSTGLAVASLLVMVMATLVACCSYCQRLRSERFQLYVTPTQDMDVSPEAGDAPQYDVVDEAKMYDGLTCEGQPASASCSGCEGQPASASCSGYEELRSVHK